MLRPLPPISQPVEVVEIPQTDPPTMIEPPPADLPPVPMVSGSYPRRERRRRPVTAPNTTTSQQIPAVDTPPASVSPEDAAIGALSLGGDTNPRLQREASDLIGSIEGRLNGLPARKIQTERSQVSRIRNFLRQSREALNSGDVEGAKTLATKANLLLDDLQK